MNEKLTMERPVGAFGPQHLGQLDALFTRGVQVIGERVLEVDGF
ncbi:hypothetical protein [Actinomadura soli]|nr:hypothetical protein [Actinomadura soli]